MIRIKNFSSISRSNTCSLFCRFLRTRKPTLPENVTSSESPSNKIEDEDILNLQSINTDRKHSTGNRFRKEYNVNNTEEGRDIESANVDLEITELKIEETVKEKPKKYGIHIAKEMRKEKKEKETGTAEKKEKKSVGLKPTDISRWDTVEAAKYLRKRVLYADKQLVILNKPYGIPAHDGDSVNMSLKSCLPVLSKMIYGINTAIPLHLCNRLDKGTTGITVCAVDKDLGHRISDLFREQKVRRKYWCVTVGVPSPLQGIVDIPLKVSHVEARRKGRDHTRMVLAPEQKLNYNSGDLVRTRSRKMNVALTHYQVLDSNGGLALVELQPYSTVKHQLRVHTADGLNSPILGDHKYSRNDDLAPQSLPQYVLRRFDIRQARSRDMPLHLHLREILIPDVLEDQEKSNLLVSAKLSEHLYQTCQLFRLKPGTSTEFKYMPRLKKDVTGSRNPHIEELFVNPFADDDEQVSNELQQKDCYTVFKPRVKVRFQYSNSEKTV